MDYIKHKNCWISICFIFVTSLLLIGPAFCFLKTDWLSIDTLLKSQSVEKNNLPLVYQKMGEIAPWVIVSLTAIIVIVGNTIFYFFSYTNELPGEQYGVKKKYFKIITFLFICCAAVLVIYIVKTDRVHTEFLAIFKEGTEDIKLIGQVDNLFGKFTKVIERYTIWTIGIFIIIDFSSFLIKRKQIVYATERLHIKIPAEMDKVIDLIKLQKGFAADQLLLIDIPVMIGVILIAIYTYLLPVYTGNNPDVKFIFITGGIGMHIIISQIIFLILNLKYNFNEFRLKQ